MCLNLQAFQFNRIQRNWCVTWLRDCSAINGRSNITAAATGVVIRDIKFRHSFTNDPTAVLNKFNDNTTYNVLDYVSFNSSVNRLLPKSIHFTLSIISINDCWLNFEKKSIFIIWSVSISVTTSSNTTLVNYSDDQSVSLIGDMGLCTQTESSTSTSANGSNLISDTSSQQQAVQQQRV